MRSFVVKIVMADSFFPHLSGNKTTFPHFCMYPHNQKSKQFMCVYVLGRLWVMGVGWKSKITFGGRGIPFA